MRAKSPCVLLAALLLALGCSSGSKADVAGDAELVVPKGLTISALAGGNGVLDLIALTLRKGPTSTELYAALKNNGDIPACSAAVSVELFDKAEQSVAAGITGLLTKHLYRLADGSGTIVACVGPGDVAMGAVTDLPSAVVIEDVATVVYRCPYFALEVAPVAGLTISHEQSVTGSTGRAYSGTMVNGLDVAVKNPSVTVFPVNRAGRPLGVASARAPDEMIAPGGSWPFETNPVDAPTTAFVTYPAAALANSN